MWYADCAADDVMGQTTGHLYYLSTESYSPSASLRGLIRCSVFTNFIKMESVQKLFNVMQKLKVVVIITTSV